MTGFTDPHQAARELILALALGQRIALPLATLHPLTHPHVPVSGAAPSPPRPLRARAARTRT